MAKFKNIKKEKVKDSKKALKKLINYCKKYWLIIIIALIFASLSAIFTIIGPNKIGEITDLIKAGIATQIDLQAILQVAIFLAVIYGAGALFGFFQNYIMATVTQKISKKLRTNINEKISKVPLQYFTDHSYGEVLSRITNDVDTIAQSFSNSLGTIVSSVVQLIGCVIIMFATNWIMASTAILSTFIGILLMGVLMIKSQKYFDMRQKYLGELNGYIEEMYQGHDIIKVSHAENQVVTKFEKMNNNVKNANFKSQFISGLLMPLMNFIGNFGFVCVCVVGAILMLNGKAGLGTITSFIIYVRLFEVPLRQIAQGMTYVQSAAASSERVFEFLEENEMENEISKNLPFENCQGEVEFKNVKFSYPSNPDKEIIHNLSFKVKPGQKLAIVGPTGAGKTTIVNLLMRFFEITQGNIYIDGIDTKELTREQVHSAFSMVLQDTWLFEGTLKENLVFNLDNISQEHLDNVCLACNLTHFVNSLPNGYDTHISNNSDISAGQKQLITIARAMLQNSPMLILDEATSSIDTRTEIQVQQAMDLLMKDRTSFVIAHRLSTIKNADLILVLKDGDIIEQGSHKELLEQKGFYAELYNSQFETI